MGFFDLFKKKSSAQLTDDPRAMFLGYVARLLQTMPGVTSVKENPEQFSLSVKASGDSENQLFLDNVFAETRELSPDDRQAKVVWFLTSMMRPPTDELPWAQAKAMLRVALRPAMHVPGALGKVDQLAREVLPCLRAHVVIDSPTSMAYALRSQLEKWGVTEEEAFGVATQNLAASGDHGVELYSETPDKVWAVEAGDSYETARLLLPGFLASFRDKVNGRVIAIAPERATLLISGDGKAATVLWMCEKAEREFAASNRSVSAAIYTVDDGGKVIPYVRQTADEAASRVNEAHVRFSGNEYAQQKQYLEQEYERDGTDVFVASFSGIQAPNGEITSYCTWTQGIDSLLPKTELVAVSRSEDPEGGFTLVKWEDAARIGAGALRHEPEFFPPRWRTIRSLTADENEAIVAAQLPR